MAMGHYKRESERAAGATVARSLWIGDVGMIADALVLGDFDWMDWFDDAPSPAFLRGFTDEVMHRDHSEGCS